MYEESGPNSSFPLMRLIQISSSLNSHPPSTVILPPVTIVEFLKNDDLILNILVLDILCYGTNFTLFVF